jgi:hypothetical protein
MAADEDTQWKGYSAYEEVASQLHKDVHKAVEAFSSLNSRSSQGVGITPQTAVNAKRDILRICKRLYYEIKRNRHVEPYDEIYLRWSGDERAPDGADERFVEAGPGYLELLEGANLAREVPQWLSQMVDDLIVASWKLGYIRSGVDKPADPNEDETQVEQMFE